MPTRLLNTLNIPTEDKHMLKKLTAALLLYLFYSNAFAWWILPHIVIVTIAYNHLTPTSQSKINTLIGKSADDLIAKNKHKHKVIIPPMLKATFFADQIKHQHGHSPNYNKFLHIIHYLNVPIKPSKKWTNSELSDAISNYLTSSNQEARYNVYTSMQAEIKTLSTKRSTKKEQQLAIAMLLDSVSDLHNFLHVANPIINGISTHGGNLIQLVPDVPLPKSQFTIQPFIIRNLHSLIDSTAGAIPPSARKSKIPYEFFSFSTKKAVELDHLFVNDKQLQKQLMLSNQVRWVQDNLSLAKALIKPSNISFSIDTASKSKVYGRFNDKDQYLAMIQKMTLKQLYLAGRRLAQILNALYDPKHATKNTLRYINKIQSSTNIPTFNKLIQSYNKQESK